MEECRSDLSVPTRNGTTVDWESHAPLLTNAHTHKTRKYVTFENKIKTCDAFSLASIVTVRECITIRHPTYARVAGPEAFPFGTTSRSSHAANRLPNTDSPPRRTARYSSVAVQESAGPASTHATTAASVRPF